MVSTPSPTDALSMRSVRSEEHTSELQSLMRNSYACFCLEKKNEIHKEYIKHANPTKSKSKTISPQTKTNDSITFSHSKLTSTSCMQKAKKQFSNYNSI